MSIWLTFYLTFLCSLYPEIIGAQVLQGAISSSISEKNVTENPKSLGQTTQKAPANADDTSSQDSMEILDSEKLGIEILGTISATDPKEGVALLKLEKGEAKAFKNTSKGNNIISTMGGVKYLLKEVFDDRMILFREGKKFLVYKDKFMQGSKAPGHRIAAAVKAVGARIADQKSYSHKNPDGRVVFNRERNSDGSVSMTMDNSYKKHLLDNLPTILMQASALPCQTSDGKSGYQLLQVDEESIFSEVALKDGDCITSINGNPLSDAASAVRLLQSLKSENKIEFEVNRGGSTSNYSLDINQ